MNIADQFHTAFELYEQDIILQLILDLVRFTCYLITGRVHTNPPSRQHTRKNQNQQRLPQNLCVNLHQRL